jgi:hypothetical protein
MLDMGRSILASGPDGMGLTVNLTIPCAVGKLLNNARQVITALSVSVSSDRCNNFLQLSDTIRRAAVLVEESRNLVWCPGHCYLISWACPLALWSLRDPSLGVSDSPKSLYCVCLELAKSSHAHCFGTPLLALSRPTLNQQFHSSTANPEIVGRTFDQRQTNIISCWIECG